MLALDQGAAAEDARPFGSAQGRLPAAETAALRGNQQSRKLLEGMRVNPVKGDGLPESRVWDSRPAKHR